MIRRRASIGLLGLLCVVFSGALHAAEDATIAPLLFDDVFLVARLNLDKLQVAPFYAMLDKSVGRGTLPSVQAAETFVARLREAKARELYVIVGGVAAVCFVPVVEGGDAKAIEAALQDSPFKSQLEIEGTARLHGGVVAGRLSMIRFLKELKAAPRPHLASALEATADCTAQLLLLPTDKNRQQACAQPWPILTLAASASVIVQLAWGSVGFDGPPQGRLKAAFEARDATAGEPLAAALKHLPEPFLLDRNVSENVALVERLREILVWKREGQRWALNVDDTNGDLTVVARGMVQPVFEVTIASTAQQQTMNHFKQIAIAFLNHHDVNKKFPSQAIVDAKGNPLLSWRVAILPFLDQHQLYKKFHLDEPWDSPHNIKLLPEMPELYRCPLAKTADDHTVYQVPRGEFTAFGGTAPIAIRQIIDGTSKTIGIVEVDDEHAVPWTRPDDWTLNADEPTAGLGGHFGDRFLCGSFDGAVHAVKLDVNPATLRALFSYSGREPEAFPE